MISINSIQRPVTMPENCGMKGMHENHSNHMKKVEMAATEQNQKAEEVRDPKIGNKLDVLA